MTFKFEKRMQPRAAFQHAAILDVLNRRTFTGGQAPAQLVNVGGGGAAITLDAEISVGDLIRLTLRPSVPAPRPGAAGHRVGPQDPGRTRSGLVVVEAQTVWVRRNGMRLLGAFTAGLSFRPASQEGIQRVLELAGLRPAALQLVGKEGSP